jgi:hypothetical protein
MNFGRETRSGQAPVMKKSTASILAALLLLGALVLGYRGYRNYKAESGREIARLQEVSASAAFAAEEKRLAAELEAQRLAATQAEREAAELAHRMAVLQREQLAAEAARLEAEQAAARLAAEQARLQRDKEAAQAEARRLAALRREESAAALAAREAALSRLQALEDEARHREAADREAARLAALQRQEALEAAAAYHRSTPARRIIYPADYKARDHHNFRALTAWESYLKAGENLPPPEAETSVPDSK